MLQQISGILLNQCVEYVYSTSWNMRWCLLKILQWNDMEPSTRVTINELIDVQISQTDDWMDWLYKQKKFHKIRILGQEGLMPT